MEFLIWFILIAACAIPLTAMFGAPVAVVIVLVFKIMYDAISKNIEESEERLRKESNDRKMP